MNANCQHPTTILGQLAGLRSGPRQDEYGLLRPTGYAFNQAVSLLEYTAIVTARQGRSVPYGCASTDSRGGVRIEWIGTKCSLHLAIPPSPPDKSYLYHEIGDDFGTIDAVTAEVLADWLQAFESGEQG